MNDMVVSTTTAAKTNTNTTKRRNNRKRSRTKTTKTAATKLLVIHCSICNKEPFKYKCPKCRVTYCSLPCYRIHQEQQQQQCLSSTQQQNPHNSNNTEISKTKMTKDDREASRKRKYDDDEDDELLKLTDYMKTRLDHSDWLKSELLGADGGGGLRQIIIDIDTSADPQRALILAKARNPKFKKFIDEMLVLVDVLQKDDDAPDGYVLKEDPPPHPNKNDIMSSSADDDNVSSSSDSDSDSSTHDDDSSSSIRR